MKKEAGQGTVFIEQTKNRKIPEDYLVTAQSTKEYLALLWSQYKVSSRKLKSQILTEIVRNLKIHRKTAIRLLKSSYEPRSRQGKVCGGKRRYSNEAKEHLTHLWRQMGYMSGIRMKAAIPTWIDHYQHLGFNNEIKAEILRMSARSIDRFLIPAKAELRRRQNAGTKRGVRRLVTEVPIRDLEHTPEVPGHCEADCVAHCGGSLSGEFAWTLTLTDIATGWTECEAVWHKDGLSIKLALEKIESRLPFKLTDLYFDNGCEFMNQDVVDQYARSVERPVPIGVHRGRPYKKMTSVMWNKKTIPMFVRSLAMVALIGKTPYP